MNPLRSMLRTAYRWQSLARFAMSDAWRFARYSGAIETKNRMVQAAAIRRDAHKLEKGLALESPRRGFGQLVAKDLASRIVEYTAKFGEDDVIQWGKTILRHYVESDAIKGRVDPRLVHRIQSLGQSGSVGGVEPPGKHGMTGDWDTFFLTRRSVRNFTGEPIPVADIQQAVRHAMRSPSVCNRQAWRVRAYLDEPSKKLALSFQNGNRGFGEKAGAVLIVTAPITAFLEVEERNQAWIDGGMFAMSLVWALHARGLGTCCLNWAATRKSDRGLRRAMTIPSDEVVVMLIAVGRTSPHAVVAASPRKSLDDVLSIHHGD